MVRLAISDGARGRGGRGVNGCGGGADVVEGGKGGRER